MSAFMKERVRATPANWNANLPAIITRDIVSLEDKVFASPVAFTNDELDQQLEFGPCDWMPRSVSQATSLLSGPAGTLATAELDGAGRTTLITDGLQWRLIRLPAGTGVTTLTGAGISVISGSHYFVQFTRPSPDGQYAIEWHVPGFSTAFPEIFEVGISAIDPASLPHRGDPCRLSFDINRIPYISWWESANG